MNAAELQSFSGAWPGVTAAATGADEFVLCVAGRAFATLCLQGPERGRLSFAVAAGQFVELTAQAGIVAAHYAARPFWITLTEPERFARARIQDFVRAAYELVYAGLSHKQRAAIATRSTTPHKG